MGKRLNDASNWMTATPKHQETKWMSEQQTENGSAGGQSALSGLVMPDGYVPDFAGDPVLASCGHCQHCMDQSDGPEYGPSWYACEHPTKSHMSNLKGFPFKTPQKCFELSWIYLVDWDAEHKKASQEA